MRRELDEYFERPAPRLRRRHSTGRSSAPRSAGGCWSGRPRIPYGQTATYRELAEAAGNRAAVRAAGTALGANPIPVVVPCHRVLRTGGDWAGYAGGLDVKRYLLDLEQARP